MLKGNERRVVIIKGGKDAIYDMACIFIKSDCHSTSYVEDDIVKEAERIIRGSAPPCAGGAKKKERIFSKSVLVFLFGVISGCALSFITYLIICTLFIS